MYKGVPVCEREAEDIESLEKTPIYIFRQATPADLDRMAFKTQSQLSILSPKRSTLTNVGCHGQSATAYLWGGCFLRGMFLKASCTAATKIGDLWEYRWSKLNGWIVPYEIVNQERKCTTFTVQSSLIIKFCGWGNRETTYWIDVIWTAGLEYEYIWMSTIQTVRSKFNTLKSRCNRGTIRVWR